MIGTVIFFLSAMTVFNSLPDLFTTIGVKPLASAMGSFRADDKIAISIEVDLTYSLSYFGGSASGRVDVRNFSMSEESLGASRCYDKDGEEFSFNVSIERFQYDLHILKKTFIMNHINSISRKSLNDKTPFELADLLLNKRLLDALSLEKIDADDIYIYLKEDAYNI